MSLDVTVLIGHCWPLLHATSSSDAVVWTDAEITRYFAEHLKRLAQNYGLFVVRDVTSITLVQGTPVYDAPPRHLSTIHVSVDDKPLVASSTSELELLDEAYRVTEIVTDRSFKRWYSDKEGVNRIGFQPVCNAALAGEKAEVIFHQFPCSINESHTDVAIDAPAVIGDLLEIRVIQEAYQKESDLEQPEVAQSCKTLAALYEASFQQYWGNAQ